jgi:hypothetical protein
MDQAALSLLDRGVAARAAWGPASPCSPAAPPNGAASRLAEDLVCTTPIPEEAEPQQPHGAGDLVTWDEPEVQAGMRAWKRANRRRSSGRSSSFNTRTG